jgi:hypothetical protein
MLVGTIVKLKKECLDNPKHTKGVCYEVYSNGNGEKRVSIIFENGKTEEFSFEEQQQVLIPIGLSEDLMNYKFENIGKVNEDFKTGVFNSVFKRIAK